MIGKAFSQFDDNAIMTCEGSSNVHPLHLKTLQYYSLSNSDVTTSTMPTSLIGKAALEEDKYVEMLETIIERDFFPECNILKKSLQSESDVIINFPRIAVSWL